MEPQSVSEYCPRCQVVQPTIQFLKDGVAVRRCQTCGSPVDATPTPEPQPVTEAIARETKILCVDDDPLILQMLGDILRLRGYTVVTATDGETRLDAAARERPDLILVDIMMPGIDGFEVCRLLKVDAVLQATPIVILTAMNDAQLSIAHPDNSPAMIAASLMAVSGELLLADILPDSRVIAQAAKMPGMVWISDPGGGAPRLGLPNPYRVAPKMMSLMYRYALDMGSFQQPDNFLIRAVSRTERILYS